MKYAYVLLAASVGILAACSRLNEHVPEIDATPDEGDYVERIIFETPALRFLGEDGETRASLSQEGDGDIHFAWEATDTLGIYPDQGGQVFFEMADGVGTSVAKFDGGGWKLRQGARYFSYFPFVGDMYLKRDAIPISFANQEQTGVSNYKSIRFFLASSGTSTPEGTLRFDFEYLNTVIRIRAIDLPAGTYTRLTLTTDEALFVQKGHFGLESMEIAGETFSNTLEVSLKDFTLTETSSKDSPVLVYLTSAPVDLREHQVIVRFYSENGDSYKCLREPLRSYEVGSWGGMKCEMTKESVIHYTSSDNHIVTPSADAFGEGVTVVSNEYVGSMGILAFNADVTEIGDHAFANCTTLTGITIPGTVTSIGDHAFDGCSNLGSDNTPTNLTQMLHAMSPFRSGETSIVIPNSVTSIGDYAFQNCTSLTSITIPDTVTSIGEGTFSGCNNLSDIDIPDSVTALGNNAFSGCNGLTSIVIPDGVTAIDDFAFAGCTGLISVSIPNSVTTIGPSAFEGCNSLTDIILPQNVGSIGDSAFWNCGFTSIIIPENVTFIGAYAFQFCSGLSSIIIPENVTHIGVGAFNDCTGLTYVTVHAVNPPETDEGLVTGIFENTNVFPIYVPSESLNAYKTAAGWSNYASRICDHVYVEMGNGMKWATTNVGAVGPDDLGNYFAWGKTEPIVSPPGNYGGNFTDTANAIWGGNWRMPTLAEWQALTDENNYTWIWDNNKKGYTVISKVEGAIDNSIFLPAAGVVGEPGILYVGQEGNYWIPSSYSEGEGYCVTLEQGGIHINGYGFSAGLSVRPVYESNPNGGLEKPDDTGIEINL